MLYESSHILKTENIIPNNSLNQNPIVVYQNYKKDTDDYKNMAVYINAFLMLIQITMKSILLFGFVLKIIWETSLKDIFVKTI